MKKVLIVGSIWPYHHGGARINSLAKYIKEFGWEPVVLTLPLPEGLKLPYQVVDIPYRDITTFLLKHLGLNPKEDVRKQLERKMSVKSDKSLVSFLYLHLREFVTYPSLNREWKNPAIKAGKELVRKENVKAIISSSPPEISHLVSKEIKRQCSIPWIADFPHLWSQNNGYPYGNIRKKLDKSLEVKTLSSADALVTTSEPKSKKFTLLHKTQPVITISHGFDPETINTIPDKVSEKFTITYTGSLAPSLREPTEIFVALKNLIEKDVIERDKIEVRLYGTKETWVENTIQKNNLNGVVTQFGKVPLGVSQQKQRESQLLLVPKWQDPEDKGIVSLKMYEYLAARRPILAVGGYKDAVDDILEETGAGICATSIEDIEQALKAFYAEYKQKGKLAFQGNTTVIDKYSQREMANKFAGILDDLTEN